MFPASQLTPYVEPEPDGGEELAVTPEVGVLPDTSMPTEEEMTVSQEEVEEGDEPIVEATGAVEVATENKTAEAQYFKTKMAEENMIEEESHDRKSVFSFSKQPAAVPTPRVNPMMGMGMMNPMMGGMGMMGGYNMFNPQQNLPASNIDDMNLCSTFVDPFAAYR